MTNADNSRLKGSWLDITPPDHFTPGGDPLVICPFCRARESMHLGGVEGQHWNFCPICGADLQIVNISVSDSATDNKSFTELNNDTKAQGLCFGCSYKTESCQEGLHCPKDYEGC